MIAISLPIACFIIGITISIRYFGNLLDFIIENTDSRGVKNGPWKTHLGVGQRATPHIEKAAIARIGLGANDSTETIYWNAYVDTDGNQLHSKYDYYIKFTSQPLVKYNEKGFWSTTIYGNDKFLVPNSGKKYIIRSDNGIISNESSELSIYLSRRNPENHSNWLPLPEMDENFSIALRCYIPENEIILNAETNVLPSIIRM